ncbi:UDP-N-acetylmuramoylalanyl-D-glutamate--2,6-diaminopimelate ligase [hydrothermal vent metagenome]|uniref:UDP-N-acetylmuramoylalanyl-D-glutamate--2,6-diaminopimelate ligase n=1 Tax=hydrothermal vent metagenome TaxID=652676 RepID=A0A3B0TB68_9ZZZZ
MKELKDILPAKEAIEVFGSLHVEVSGIVFDSRKVKPGCLFVAARGTRVDGHRFIQGAIENGAVAVVCEDIPTEMPGNITFIKVNNSSRVLGGLAAAFYGFPSKTLKIVGVTGTNGKTSIVTLLHGLFTKLGYKAGLISTIKNSIGGKETRATHTTPDAVQIQRLFAEMVDAGCAYCFMEVSSHAIHQGRIAGVGFSGGIFTNLTHDHLDYHKTFAEYLKAKKMFFDGLPGTAFALTNIDDKNGLVMVQNTKAKIITYSIRALADFRCKVLERHFDGMLLNIDNREVWAKFVGNFNAYNLLAVYVAAISLGQEQDEVLSAISELEPVRGRFETIRSLDGKLAIVDYAHTPDALQNVLNTISEIRSHNEQVITVVGAGGDRDKSKRPEMAREAVLASDKVILTSDNPRSEVPEQIIADMEAGLDALQKKKVLSIVNRKEAIKTALMLAGPGDIILVSGKGHEDYQEVKGVKHHFDDKEVIEEIFGII